MACMKNGFAEGLVLDGRFVAVSPLNHGSFGMVFLAKDLQTNEHVAIKCLAKPSLNSPSPENLTNDHLVELLCHERLGHHPNIVNLLHAFETDAHMFLVLEFCSMGDLYEAIRLNRGPLETEHVRAFMLQLVDAIDFMHSKGLYHRDIKPENIFLAADGSMKLGDFGLSTTETWTYEACVGSDRYMAPEQYDPADTGYDPAQADIWSIGICLLNILFSRNPFVTPTESDVLFADFARDRDSLFDIFPSLSQDAFEVLIHALAVDPSKRSLSAIRSALERVVTFTSDDDILDEFCTEDRDVVPATANRQPLRTPSIQSPPIEQGGAFPWAKVLHMSPRQPAPRQLSVIHDDELFPEQSIGGWHSNPADLTSMDSMVDSALGVSVNSMTLREPKPRNPPRPGPAPVSESLPSAAPKPIRALSSIFGKKDTMSKSWSDLWDEDEEAEEEELDARRRYNAHNWSSESVDEDVTITRKGLSEIKNPSVTNAKNSSPLSHDDFVMFGDSSEDVASIDMQSQPSPKTPVYSPPAKRSVMDKWAALGNRRRAATNEPAKKVASSTVKASSGGTWRNGFGLKALSGNRGISFGEGTNLGSGKGLGFKGWKHRGENKTAGKEVPGAIRIRDWRRDDYSRDFHRYQYGTSIADDFDSLEIDDDRSADVEWVGGWTDPQL